MLITNILLAVLLSVFCISLLVFNAKIQRIRSLLLQFITPANENEASPLGMAVEANSSSIARAVVAQAKATFMANESARVRGEAAVDGDINEGLATANNPLLAGLASQFPALRKTLRRNPALINYAIERLGVAKTPGNGSNAQVKFKL